MGKTSTLRVIEDRQSKESIQGIKILYKSLESVDDFDRLGYELKEQGLPLSEGQIDKSLVRALHQFSESQKAHIVLALDEVDRLLNYDARNDWRLFRALRAEAQAPRAPFSLLVAGFPSLYRYLHDGNSPLFNFGPEIVLRQLKWLDVYELVKTNMDSMEISIDEDTIRKIYDSTSGEPSLVQLLCETAITGFSSTRMSPERTPDSSRVIFAKIIERTAKDDEFVKEYFKVTFGEFLSPVSRLTVLCALNLDSNDFEERALVEIVRNTFPGVQIAEVQSAISLLTTYLLEREGKHLRWAMPTFRAMMKQHRDINLEIENILQQLVGSNA